MIHFFNTNVAERYGVNCAILLENIYHWVKKNEANGQNFHDGKYWTYNSRNAWSTLFHYMNARQIGYALNKLIDEGILETGNYNDSAYDRTLWYAITEKGFSILQNCEMDETKNVNRNDEIVTPIPYINTDSKPNNKPDNKLEETRVSKDTLPKEKSGKSENRNMEEVFEEFIEDRFSSVADSSALHEAVNEFVEHRSSIKKKLTPTALKLNLEKAYRLAEGDYFRTCELILNAVANGWQGIYDDSSYSRRSQSSQFSQGKTMSPDLRFSNEECRKRLETEEVPF